MNSSSPTTTIESELARIGMNDETQGPCRCVCATVGPDEDVPAGVVRLWDDWAEGFYAVDALRDALAAIPDQHFADPENYGDGGEGFWGALPTEVEPADD